jgi:hypothetical protein
MMLSLYLIFCLVLGMPFFICQYVRAHGTMSTLMHLTPNNLRDGSGMIMGAALLLLLCCL